MQATNDTMTQYTINTHINKMSTPKTLIVGHGEIGSMLERELEPIHPDVADIKYVGYIKGTPQWYEYDAIFICVPAEINGKNPCDLTAVENAINTNIERLSDGGVFVICTTVLPGSTIEIKRRHPYVPFVCSPIWYGCTIHSERERFKFDFTVLGGERPWTNHVQQILQKCHDASHRFIKTTSINAELAKYMENCAIAFKVVFCAQFADMATRLNADYNEVREIFIADPRISPYHTFVDPSQPFFNSHCTTKDVQALAMLTNNPLLNAMWQINGTAQPSPADFFAEDADLPM